MRESTSLAVAPPRLTTNPACFSLTCAPPTVSPFSPAASMSAPAKWPSGRLKVEPALGKESGCFSAAGVQFLHARKDGRGVVPREAEARPQHGQAAFERQSYAVTHLQRLAAEDDFLAVLQHGRLDKHIESCPP